MCLITVEGTDGFFQSECTVSGDLSNERNVSGLSGGAPLVLLGTQPTVTEISTVGVGSYTTPPGCVYIEAYVFGAGGGAAGGGTGIGRRQGGGGGGGGAAVAFFQAGTYSYEIKAGGAGGAAGTNGSQSSGSTFFATISATGGGGGQWAAGAGSQYYGGAKGTALNSVYPLGISAAGPPGDLGANGGANFVKGLVGLGYQSNILDRAGVAGITGGGGGSSSGNAAGGDGSDGHIMIIEYY